MPQRQWPSCASARGAEGAITLEFVLIFMTSILVLFAPAGEFFRLSFIDQTLARTTHLAARAAGSDPSNCQAAVKRAFEGDDAARWLLDLDGNGEIGMASGNEGWPDSSSTEEVQVGVSWDGDLSDGAAWSEAGCGDPGSWIRVRARVRVQPWFGPVRALWADGIRRQHESWARNQG